MAKVTIDRYGTKEYLNDVGRTHREDGPAIITPYGYKAWYIDDWLKCIDGNLSEIEPNGNRYWVDGMLLNRYDGPAQIEPNGYKKWRISGEVIWPKLN